MTWKSNYDPDDDSDLTPINIKRKSSQPRRISTTKVDLPVLSYSAGDGSILTSDQYSQSTFNQVKLTRYSPPESALVLSQDEDTQRKPSQPSPYTPCIQQSSPLPDESSPTSSKGKKNSRISKLFCCLFCPTVVIVRDLASKHKRNGYSRV